MKLISLLIMNNATAYGRAQPLRQVVLFVFVPFDKNTLGDVVAILDDVGNEVGHYEYNAWGEITSQDGAIPNINPVRYRGYYYDVETGFYYLQTRYYDPTICRFINADNYELVATLSSVPGQLNMYAYCGNNPIMYTDETGEFWVTAGVMLVGALIGTVSSAVASVVTQAMFEGEINLKSVAIAAGTGFISGALSASPLGVGWLMVANAVLEVGSYCAECFIRNEDPSVIGVGVAIASGLVFGKLGGNGANYKFKISNSIERVNQIIMRENRRANQKYAEKAIKSASRWLDNELFDQIATFSLGSYFGTQSSMWVGRVFG